MNKNKQVPKQTTRRGITSDTDSYLKNTKFHTRTKKQNRQREVSKGSLTSCCDALTAAVDCDCEKDKIQSAKIINPCFFLLTHEVSSKVNLF